MITLFCSGNEDILGSFLFWLGTHCVHVCGLCETLNGCILPLALSHFTLFSILSNLKSRQMCWPTSLVLTFGRLRQEEGIVKASLGCIVRSNLKKKRIRKKEEEELEEGNRIILYLIINIYMPYRPSLCDYELLPRRSLCYLHLWPGPFCTLHLCVPWPVLSRLGI